jgi:hypothetical protein
MAWKFQILQSDYSVYPCVAMEISGGAVVLPPDGLNLNGVTYAPGDILAIFVREE